MPLRVLHKECISGVSVGFSLENVISNVETKLGTITIVGRDSNSAACGFVGNLDCFAKPAQFLFINTHHVKVVLI